MSHLILRMGDLLHFHPFAHRLVERNTTLPEGPPVDIVGTQPSAAPDELAFFSLSVLGPIEDPRVDLEHFALTGHEGADPSPMDVSLPPCL